MNSTRQGMGDARAWLVVALLLTASCASVKQPSVPSSVTPAGWTAVEGNAGGIQVMLRASPDELPLGQPFELHVRVQPASRAETLHVEAVMPEHRHGMNVEPKVIPLGDGVFRVEGMLFHMPGRWQLHLDVTSGAVTERAQLDVTL